MPLGMQLLLAALVVGAGRLVLMSRDARPLRPPQGRIEQAGPAGYEAPP
jgi:hypothetical protein